MQAVISAIAVSIATTIAQHYHLLLTRPEKTSGFTDKIRDKTHEKQKHAIKFVDRQIQGCILNMVWIHANKINKVIVKYFVLSYRFGC